MFIQVVLYTNHILLSNEIHTNVVSISSYTSTINFTSIKLCTSRVQNQQVAFVLAYGQFFFMKCANNKNVRASVSLKGLFGLRAFCHSTHHSVKQNQYTQTIIRSTVYIVTCRSIKILLAPSWFLRKTKKVLRSAWQHVLKQEHASLQLKLTSSNIRVYILLLERLSR